jgi:hypothetical protein
MIIRGPNPSEKRCALSAYANVVILTRIKLLVFHRLLETSPLIGENVDIVFILSVVCVRIPFPCWKT